MFDSLTVKLVAVYFSLDVDVLSFVVDVAKSEDEAF